MPCFAAASPHRREICAPHSARDEQEIDGAPDGSSPGSGFVQGVRTSPARVLCTRSSMRKAIAIFFVLLCATAALAAQSVIIVSPQQCVWRAGDYPAWAAPNLDESAWKPYTGWKLNPDQPHYWVRCHADLSPLQGLAHPAIQVTLYAAYQIYLDGAPIGEAGNLRSGNYSMDSIRRFPVPASHLLAQPAIIAVRITYRYADPWVGASDRSLPTLQNGASVNLEAGDSTVLEGRRANAILAQLRNPFISFVSLGVIGVLGLVLLAQFFQDRSRYDLLYLSLTAVATTVVNTRLLCIAALWDFPVYANVGLYASAVMVIVFTQPFFSFSVAARRVPLVFWILVVISLFRNVLQSLGLFLSPAHSLAFEASVTASVWVRSLSYAAISAASAAPFVAFWPYRNLARRMMPLAALCMAWGATMVHYYATDLLLTNTAALEHMFPGAQQVVIAWHFAASRAFTAVSACVMIVLMGLLSRDQQRTARERAELAGEMAVGARDSAVPHPRSASTHSRARHPQRLPAIARSGRRFLSGSSLPARWKHLDRGRRRGGKGTAGWDARGADCRRHSHCISIHPGPRRDSIGPQRAPAGPRTGHVPGHAHRSQRKRPGGQCRAPAALHQRQGAGT